MARRSFSEGGLAKEKPARRGRVTRHFFSLTSGRLTKSPLFSELLFSRPGMETPLMPLEFARRARKLYPKQIAVIDGESRWNYAQFLDRCNRWSTALQELGIGSGDRVAYLAPNSHAQLESFYAVPQIGAVLVPLNHCLIADDFVYLLTDSGARIVCADCDYLETIDSIRSRLPDIEHFVALTGEANDWLDYETLLSARDDNDRFLVVIAHRAAQS